MTYKKFTVCCLDCTREVTVCNLSKHVDSKSCLEFKELKQQIDALNNRLSCKFCEKKINSGLQLLKHESICSKNPEVPKMICRYCNQEYLQYRHPVSCKSNPDRKKLKTGNQFIKAKETGVEYEIKDSTRKKLSEQNSKRKHTTESIEKLKKSMAKAVENNPKSYCGWGNTRVKKQMCSNGFSVIGKWEQKFVEWCLINDIEIHQPKTWFPYTFEGVNRKYFPDFYLPKYDLWVEVKGYKIPKDDVKWYYLRNIHNKKLFIVDSSNINNLDGLNLKQVFIEHTN